MPTSSRTRRAGGTKRLAVLDAVIDVLTDRGYEATRFADVSAASGAAVSTLQNYFGSREDMLIEALQRATDQEMTSLEAVAAAQPGPWDTLVALADRSLDSSERTQQLLIEFWRSAMRDKELRAHSDQVQARYRAPFLNAVLQGTAQGTFHPAHGPDEITDFLLAALAGIMIPRILHQPLAARDAFRSLFLDQLATALGRQPSGEEKRGMKSH